MRITLKQACDRLFSGDVVAIPTETVYGLAARLTDVRAVQKIFTLKGRPQDNPLIVHVSQIHELDDLVEHVPKRFSLLKNFWPGPLTVILTAQCNYVPSVVRAGLETVGVRMPDSSLTRELISTTGPLVAPSANLSGKPSATCPEHVEADFGKDFPILDGGHCTRGVESTIIALTDAGHWELLRSGAISREDLEKVLGEPPFESPADLAPRSPGQKYRHYAPQAKLKLCEDTKTLTELAKTENFSAILGFDDSPTGLPLISLGSRNDYATNLNALYSALRELDARGFDAVLVDVEFLRTGLGLTLIDRLNRAEK